MRLFLLLLPVYLLPEASFCQVVKSVVLDSVVVQAVKRGFDVSDFIQMVRSDTSFINGFRQLRTQPHEVEGAMTIYGRKGEAKASRTRKGRQVVENNRRWMELEKDEVTGRFYDRKGEPILYTALLFDDLFFYKDTVSVRAVSSRESDDSGNIGKLKKLVFNPGSDINGIPLIGNRMAVFDESMSAFYDYFLKADVFGDSIPCYVFSLRVRSGFEDDVVIRSMNTWFNRKTFDIVYRDYKVGYKTPLFDFNVEMKIRMDYHGNILYPSQIKYSGYWDLPLKKTERADFMLNFKMK